MHFYSYNLEQTKALLLKTFWLMSNNIDRIMAQADMRSLTIGSASQSSEGASEYRRALVIEVGTIVKTGVVYERDEEGVAWLKGVQ